MRLIPTNAALITLTCQTAEIRSIVRIKPLVLMKLGSSPKTKKIPFGSKLKIEVLQYKLEVIPLFLVHKLIRFPCARGEKNIVFDSTHTQ